MSVCSLAGGLPAAGAAAGAVAGAVVGAAVGAAPAPLELDAVGALPPPVTIVGVLRAVGVGGLLTLPQASSSAATAGAAKPNAATRCNSCRRDMRCAATKPID